MAQVVEDFRRWIETTGASYFFAYQYFMWQLSHARPTSARHQERSADRAGGSLDDRARHREEHPAHE